MTRNREMTFLEKHVWFNKNTVMLMTWCIILIWISLPTFIGATVHYESGDISTTKPFEPTPDKPFDVLMHEANFIMHRDMDSAERTGNPDHDFVTVMLPHHQGAVNMARVLLLHGRDKEIRDFAQRIIYRQQNETAFMQDWLKGHTTRKTVKGNKKMISPFNELMNKAMGNMREDLREAFRLIRPDDPDHDFVNVMIPQRRSAVDTARALVTYGKDPQIIDLAKKIIEEQQAEIQSMQKWLKKHREELPH
jgi:uncharacterized protein (DUF305 family)